MASKFDELFSDFKELVKVYTDVLDVTPLIFMRFLTQGVQIFQRETEIVQKAIILAQTGDPPVYMMPDDMFRIIEIRDYNDIPVRLQSFEQFKRNVDLYESGYRRTPNTDITPLLGNKLSDWNNMRLATVWDRRILMHPWIDDTSIAIWYIPDLSPISRGSDQWTDWYIDEESFDTQFKTTSLTPNLQPYESALVDYAISTYLKSKGNANQKVYEEMFYTAIQLETSKGKTYFQQGGSDYYMGIDSIPTEF
jgi:hypothetical protein